MSRTYTECIDCGESVLGNIPLCDACNDVRAIRYEKHKDLESRAADLRALHDRVFLAALTGLLARENNPNSIAQDIDECIGYSTESVRQYEAMTAERDAAIDAALAGKGE